MVEIYASVLGVENPKNEIKNLEQAGADGIQLDVMDGKYNSNNTLKIFNPENTRILKSKISIPIEVHLMIKEPWKKINDFSKSCETIIFHYEACVTNEKINKTIEKIKSCGVKIGIAIEPETHFSKILDYLKDVDLVLIMTVRTGYAGQKFINRTNEIKELIKHRGKKGLKYLIEVDGGINEKTINLVKGVDRVVSASFILNSFDKKKAIRTLRDQYENFS